MNDEPLSFLTLDRTLLAELSAAARLHPRRRLNRNLHAMDDPSHRLLNAIEPGSYVRPHRHLTPPKSETIVLGGFLTGFTPWLAPPIEKQLAARVLGSQWVDYPVHASTVGALAPLVGAGWFGLRRVLADPLSIEPIGSDSKRPLVTLQR